MNDTARVAAIAMHSEMGDPEENLKRVEHWMREAHAQGATFALFTEECVTGSMNKSDLTFPEAMEIAKYAAAVTGPRLESLCREMEMTAVVGLIEPAGERFLNSALIVGPEGRLATFRKLHLPKGTERKWFLPGDTLPVHFAQSHRKPADHLVIQLHPETRPVRHRDIPVDHLQRLLEDRPLVPYRNRFDVVLL